MYQRLVAMPMGVWRRIRHWRVAGVMRVLVMFVVHVRVVMIQHVVPVLVHVLFAHVQPNSDRHESGGDDEHRRRLLPENQQ